MLGPRHQSSRRSANHLPTAPVVFAINQYATEQFTNIPVCSFQITELTVRPWSSASFVCTRLTHVMQLIHHLSLQLPSYHRAEHFAGC